jgi:hypothetical protein
MKESKFYDVITESGVKTINVNNIALIESVNNGTKITLNVKNEDGNNISFIINLSYSLIASQITQKDLNQH